MVTKCEQGWGDLSDEIHVKSETVTKRQRRTLCVGKGINTTRSYKIINMYASKYRALNYIFLKNTKLREARQTAIV